MYYYVGRLLSVGRIGFCTRPALPQQSLVDQSPESIVYVKDALVRILEQFLSEAVTEMLPKVLPQLMFQ